MWLDILECPCGLLNQAPRQLGCSVYIGERFSRKEKTAAETHNIENCAWPTYLVLNLSFTINGTSVLFKTK